MFEALIGTITGKIKRENAAFAARLEDESRIQHAAWSQKEAYRKSIVDALKMSTYYDFPTLTAKTNEEFAVKEKSGKWLVRIGWCCLRGEDLTEAFDTEQEARRYAYMLTVSGYVPARNVSCSPCYTEYAKDCI